MVTKHICLATKYLCRATKNVETFNNVTCRTTWFEWLKTSWPRFETYCHIVSGPKSILISKSVLVQSCTDWFQSDWIGSFHSNTWQPVNKRIYYSEGAVKKTCEELANWEKYVIYWSLHPSQSMYWGHYSRYEGPIKRITFLSVIWPYVRKFS